MQPKKGACLMSGSGEKSRSKSESQGRSKTLPQEDVLTQFLKSERGRIGAGQRSFEGDRVAGFSDLQETALGLAPETLFRTPQQEADLFKFGIEEPARRRFLQETVPLIREEFSGPGFFSSARAQETVRAGEDFASGLERTRQDLRRETEDINRQGLSGLFAFGQQQQQLEQQQINAEIEKFIEQNRLTNPEDAAIITALLGLDFGTTSMRQRSSTDAGGGGVGKSS